MNAQAGSCGRFVGACVGRIVGLACIILALSIAGCHTHGQDEQPPHIGWDLRIALSPQERAYLESLPPLRIGTDPHWAPIAFLDPSGRVGGISADYLDFVRQTLGLRLHIVPTGSWAKTVQLANEGGLDLVVATSRSDGLNSTFKYTTPYGRYPLVIVTRETAPFIAGAGDISGAEVAIVKDSDALTAELPGMHDTHKVIVSSAEEGLDAVAQGKAYAYIGNLGVIDRLVREKYEGVLRIAAPAGYVEELSFGVGPQYAPLIPLVNRALAAIPESEREHIQNSWLSARFTFGVPARTLWIVLTPIAVLTALFLAVLCVYMLRLRKEVRQRRSTERQLVELTQSLPAIVFQLRFVRTKHAAAVPFTLVFVNRRAYDWLNPRAARADELFKRFLVALDAQARFRLMHRFLNSTVSLETVRAELALSLNAPRPTWVELEAAPQFHARGEIVWSGYVRDITETKETQTALIDAKHDAEEASRARDVFLATVSHEIRTPMSGVVGILQLLDHGRLPPDDQHLVDMARNAAEILLRILNDVLDFAKSENGELTLECQPFSLADVAQRTAGIAAPELERKGLRFAVEVARDLAPRYLGDAQRLGQVLLNLLGNASKFTDYGFVSLSVRLGLRENGIEHVVIEVADTGIGIAQEDQARLFAPFAQARSLSASRPPGTGLGLVICKRLIESMGGTIALTSELGRGTTIAIDLPLRIDPAVRAPCRDTASHRTTADPAAAATGPLQILVVEDQEINREVLKRQILTLRIAECHTAVDGAQALRMVERQAYAMVITDCMMPGMDGVALIRHIRELERKLGRRRMPLIALTANAMPQQREACFTAGADDVFVKPVGIDALRTLLQQHGIVAPPIVELEKAGIPAERHTDLWEKLQRTLVSELSALLGLSLEQDTVRAKEIVHRIVGTAAWFHLQAVAQAATRLEACLENGEPPHGALFELQTAISRATGEMSDSAAGAPS